eukprot:3628143-Rhodomonas_salina.5
MPRGHSRLGAPYARVSTPIGMQLRVAPYTPASTWVCMQIRAGTFLQKRVGTQYSGKHIRVVSLIGGSYAQAQLRADTTSAQIRVGYT